MTQFITPENYKKVGAALKGQLLSEDEGKLWQHFGAASRNQFIDAVTAELGELVGATPEEPPHKATERAHEAQKATHKAIAEAKANRGKKAAAADPMA